MAEVTSETESCTDVLIQEFQPDKVGLNHENPSDFVRSQWPTNQKIFLCYRVLIALFGIGWVIADIMYESQKFYRERVWEYLVYATNWSFLLLGITTCFQALCTAFYTIRSCGYLDRQTFSRMPPSLKVQWCLQNLSFNSSIVVTISYWSFLMYDHSDLLQTDMSHVKHTLNTVYVIFDVMVTAVPFRILHMIMTIMLGSSYSLFNALYFLNNGKILDGRHYAYQVLKWTHPSEAIVTCVLCLFLAILSQLILYGLYKLRHWIFSKIYFQDGNGRSDGEMQSIITDDAPKYMTIDESQEYVNDK
ncbi:hypothetical protein KUTeg_020788 [Tegillarca granosa]|uniref:Protein rolling stone n=1 Tax=Tegillarca granosa TaxID=220873 RepID=A0ABQ9EBM5_TEGGR|nr:hypothetical protein KUTeg_020788 [Tegillarca granosa]